MSKLRIGDPWMPAPDYGRSLAGLGVNLLVRDVAAALPFQREVLDAEVVYSDSDVAALRRRGAEWMLHAHHTYDAHPWYPIVASDAPRGVGAELRLHGRDPDAAEAAARRLGFEVLQSAADKPHGLREAFITDRDGFVWVPDVPIGQSTLSRRSEPPRQRRSGARRIRRDSDRRPSRPERSPAVPDAEPRTGRRRPT